MFSKIDVKFLWNSMMYESTLTILVALLVCLPGMSGAHSLIVYPCVDVGAIRWVRDSAFCDQYYICHFGQPLTMPSCPSGQVWSNRALNCVPKKSRWDDCTVPEGVTTGDDATSTPNNKLTTQEHFIYKIPSDVSRTRNNVVVSIQPIPEPQSHSQRRPELVMSQDKTRIARTEVILATHKPNQGEDRTRIARTEVTLATHKPDQGEDRTRIARTEVTLATHKPDQGVSKNWYDIDTPHNHDWDNDDYTLEPTWTTTVKSPDSGIMTSPSVPPPEERHGSKAWNDDKRVFLQRLNITVHRLNIDTDHQCLRHPEALLPHSENCHWYFNCSLANLDDVGSHLDDDDADARNDETRLRMEPFRVRQAGVFVWECRYPQLFDDATGRCREFMNVDCKSRFQPVDQCEYTSRQCTGAHCVPCERRYGRCRGRPNGVYPLHPTRWTPMFVTCYQERNIAQDECSPPTPIFSPDLLDCVSLFEVPKQHGGFLPDCSTRPDGYYPDEQGRCAIFFRCALGNFRGYDECPPGTVFDPAVPSCQPYSQASKPCGEGQAPLCGGKLDGLYADPHGRCTTYFECQHGLFQQYFTCDLGIFDPLTQTCVLSAELTVRPCGLQPSPCEALPTGVYPDQETGCQHFIECNQGNMITNGTCGKGTIFSAITGRCDLPEHTPPPCGVSTACSGRPDGRYPALSRGCSFFYECYHGEFVSLRRCTEADGGIFFNMETGSCDYPQNICPPCGYRWWGCPRTYETQTKTEKHWLP